MPKTARIKQQHVLITFGWHKLKWVACCGSNPRSYILDRINFQMMEFLFIAILLTITGK